MTTSQSEKSSNLLTYMVLGALVLQVALSAGILLRVNQVYQLAMASPANVLQAAEESTIQVSADDDPTIGPESAPVTIVAFSDFSCGACSQVQPTLKEIQDQYGDQVRIVFRDFPRGGEGYPGFNAALAAECAKEQEAFWEMHDKLFENAPAFDNGSLRVYATQLGLDAERFDACLESAEAQAEVEHDLSDGRSYGVAATPTFFVNGKQVVGSVAFLVFQREIEAALKK
ncbi:MAG: DsbA family protein [Anaerolineae bacterium]|nr:DsbA family protein [Anaerolineae bacterium]